MNLKELDSFKMSDAVKFHNELNPNLWYGSRLRPEVKKQLKIIADDFIDELGVSGLDVLDLTISGSNAAYSYTPHSDLDLHILIDMNQLSNDEVYRELFNAKKTIYNDTHNIKIHGVPVELYVQDANEPVISLGEYSILQDKWLKLPSKRRANLDQNSARAKYEKLHTLIKHALKLRDLKRLNNVIKKIKQYRQAGLDSGGEFGPENLAYKALRTQDYITKLYDLRDKLHGEELTIETMYSQPEHNKLLNRPTLSARMLAAKHNVSVGHIITQLRKGIEVEKEHTTYGQTAREIALDHLSEDPNYYTKLKKANLEEDKYDDLPERVYHVTPSENLDSIMSKGLLPQIGDRTRKIVDEKPAIYCFPDKNAMEDALMNWLGDEFDEDEALALLEIYTAGLKGQVTEGAEYEVAITSAIPPQNIRIISRDLATPITESIVKEAFNQPYPIKWEKGDHGDLDALAKLPDGSPLSIMFNQQQDDDGDEITQVEFYRNNSQEVTGEGDAQRIFATVLTAIQQYIKKRKPLRLTFAASKQIDPTVYYEPDQPQPNPESRAKLYDRLVQRYAKAWGYRAFRADNGDLVMYELSRINKKVAETGTMQYAAEKTPVVSPYAGLKDNQYRGSISEAPIIGNYADLYHTAWTDNGALDSILQSGKLIPGQNKWLSLTRDSRLDYAKMMGQFAEFVVDQNKLRQRVKLDQYDDFKGKGDDEAEERVNVPIPLKGYVKAIHLPASWKHDEQAMKYYEPKLKQYGIPFYYDTMGSREDRNADVPRLEESSGYIPSEKEKNDPRFSTALTVDVKPDSIKKNAKAFNSKVSRAGIPPTLNPSGKF
jgi:hypothetical protein